jgi:hypothetical protein
MLAEVRLVVTHKEARLTLVKGDDVSDDEVWKFDKPLGRSQAFDLANCFFQDGFDLMQFMAHGE